MSVVVGVLTETAAKETRVAVVPEIATKLKALGVRVLIERGAGAGAHFPDASYADAEFSDAAAILASADVLLKVQPPSVDGSRGAEERRRRHRLHAGLCAARTGAGAQGTRHHELRHGAGAAHFTRAIDGCAVVASFRRRLQGGADRRQYAGEIPAHAHHRRRHHPARGGARDRRRGRRPAGDRHGEAPGCGGRSVRRAQRHQGPGEIAGRQIRRDRRLRRGRRRLCPRTHPGGKGEAAGGARCANRRQRRGDQHGVGSGAGRAADHIARRRRCA